MTRVNRRSNNEDILHPSCLSPSSSVLPESRGKSLRPRCFPPELDCVPISCSRQASRNSCYDESEIRHINVDQRNALLLRIIASVAANVISAKISSRVKKSSRAKNNSGNTGSIPRRNLYRRVIFLREFNAIW